LYQFQEMISAANNAGHNDQPILMGDSIQVLAIRQLVMLAAQSKQPVQIWGPAGAGHLSVARAIHNQTKGDKAPFIDASQQKIAEHNLAYWNKGTVYLGDLSRLPMDMRQIVQNWRCSSVSYGVRTISKSGAAVSAAPLSSPYNPMLVIPCPPLASRSADIPAIMKALWKADGLTAPKLDRSAWSILKSQEWHENFDELSSFSKTLAQLYAGKEVSQKQLRYMLNARIASDR
jgi:DNA-binding NtrC family response regulator